MSYIAVGHNYPSWHYLSASHLGGFCTRDDAGVDHPWHQGLLFPDDMRISLFSVLHFHWVGYRALSACCYFFCFLWLAFRHVTKCFIKQAFVGTGFLIWHLQTFSYSFLLLWRSLTGLLSRKKKQNNLIQSCCHMSEYPSPFLGSIL